MDESASALEHFRQQWKEEVNARSQRPDRRPSEPKSLEKARRTSDVRLDRPVYKPPTRHPAADIKDEPEHYSDEEQATDDATSSMIQRIEGLSIRNVDDDDFTARGSSREPTSALEHYERAVEKESQGNLGDSLSHYRKAYRLDAKVDQSYRNKHFPAKSKPADPNPSNAAVTVPSTAHHSSKEPTEVLTFAQLIDSFADTQIMGVLPLIEGDRPPPCGIKKLPTEVLLELLQHVAIRDPAMFVRLSLVCKKLAYHVLTENAIWKRVALGPEFGLAGQRYDFATDLQGRESINRTLGTDSNIEDEEAGPSIVTEASFPKDTVWRNIFQNYPRVRFSGVYISTVNYTRPGGASANPNTWNNAIHIVTYYRYLRFFRDGTCISLLTTNEPIEVVHHLTPANLNYVRTGKKESAHPLNFTSSAPALWKESSSGQASTRTGAGGGTNAAPSPSAQQIMKHALRGRWRLCHPSLEPADSIGTTTTTTATANAASTHSEYSPRPIYPGDLHIETEGAGPRYMYTLHLSLKSAGSARSKHTTKNNKLQWKGFWSYNLLTNDWAEFTLRNDKPFYFSRVKTYGLGY
ncbi:hypothetical protein A1O3_02420 [Capronia epimyces CBS 606.96]|uniref:F-box domain-containing protein n=1 Tax=Capronia epimyces CBS 606.96 TaxID=1182542 RepID=W9YA44_9EURO|nr:uncharacterized protein A1O3_02420 [Capronia epimyces CBS 606.96]EXJ89353.1 hypothetical protein A1O3_02420 [Capronia epimyces CBS 606.96]